MSSPVTAHQQSPGPNRPVSAAHQSSTPPQRRNSPQTRPLTSTPASQTPNTRAAKTKKSNGGLFKCCKRKKTRNVVKEWRAFSLQHWFLTTCIVIEIAVIVAILVLNKISRRNSGLATIGNEQFLTGNAIISNITGGEALLWTTIPNLIMSVYRLMWSSIVSSSADRQPFVELRNVRKPASARKTILLDYRSILAIWSWCAALRHGHIAIGFGMALDLLLSVGIVPLSAHLFDTTLIALNSTVSLESTTFYNSSGFTGQSDIRPAIDVTSATRIYGGLPPVWTTLEYAFPPFTMTQASRLGNITLNTTAYSASANCVSVPASDYDVSPDEGFISISVDDRGCKFTQSLTISNTTETYLSSWAVQDCSFAANISRIGVVAAELDLLSALGVNNISVISCETSYWTTPGNVTVSNDGGSTGFVYSFTPSSNASSSRPDLWAPFENVLHQISILDPTNTYQADDFSRVVYTLSSKFNPSSPLDSSTLVNAFELVFSTVYAMTTNALLFQQAGAPTPFDGTLTVTENRLYVIAPIAYTIAAFMCVIVIFNILFFINSYKNHSILLEEPVGLLGYAALLDQSNLMDIVRAAKIENPPGGRVEEFIEDEYTVRDSKCYFSGKPELNGKLVVDGLKKKAA